jgi:hypothetical protein
MNRDEEFEKIVKIKNWRVVAVTYSERLDIIPVVLGEYEWAWVAWLNALEVKIFSGICHNVRVEKIG